MMNGLKILVATSLVTSGLVALGCQTTRQSRNDDRMTEIAASRSRSLVMPGQNLLSLTGENQWLAQEQRLLMGRRDSLLNVGRIPAFAPIYVAQIRTWDQQQIINGRPNEFFIRTNRSLETNGPR